MLRLLCVGLSLCCPPTPSHPSPPGPCDHCLLVQISCQPLPLWWTLPETMRQFLLEFFVLMACLWPLPEASTVVPSSFHRMLKPTVKTADVPTIGKGGPVVLWKCGGNIGHVYHDGLQGLVLRLLDDPHISIVILFGPSEYCSGLARVASHGLAVNMIEAENDTAVTSALVVHKPSMLLHNERWALPSYLADVAKSINCSVATFPHTRVLNNSIVAPMVKLIRRNAWAIAGVNRTNAAWRVLYPRTDANYRRLLDPTKITCHFDEVVHSMSLPFFEQVRIFARSSLFVTVCGAATTNIIFMPPSAVVIAVQPLNCMKASQHQITSTILNLLQIFCKIIENLSNVKKYENHRKS